MTTSGDCKNNIVMYKNLKAKVKLIISYLNKYDDVDDKLLLKISQNYSVNSIDVSIHDRIKDLTKDVNKTSNYLKNIILPAIDAAIKNESALMVKLEAEELAAALDKE